MKVRFTCLEATMTDSAPQVRRSTDGRKSFVSATMTDFEDTVRSDATGLILRLLPHQP